VHKQGIQPAAAADLCHHHFLSNSWTLMAVPFCVGPALEKARPLGPVAKLTNDIAQLGGDLVHQLFQVCNPLGAYHWIQSGILKRGNVLPGKLRTHSPPHFERNRWPIRQPATRSMSKEKTKM
jgi:hypothetical protein